MNLGPSVLLNLSSRKEMRNTKQLLRPEMVMNNFKKLTEKMRSTERLFQLCVSLVAKVVPGATIYKIISQH